MIGPDHVIYVDDCSSNGTSLDLIGLHPPPNDHRQNQNEDVNNVDDIFHVLI